MFARKGDEISDAIVRAEALLDVLRLSKVDLTAPEELLAEARRAAEEKRYPEAQALAARAESLANTLEERHRAARKALTAARSLAKKARSMGLDASELDLAVEAARRVSREGTVEDGLTIPNYLQARALLDVALNSRRPELDRASAVADEIFTAELSVDALKDANGNIDREEFDRVVLTDVRALVENAKALFSKGRLEEAKAAAESAEEAAKRARLDYEDAIRAFRAAEKTLADLRAEGAVAVGPERLLDQGQSLLRQAKLGEAREVLVRVERDAGRLAEVFRRATRSVQETEQAISALARGGEVPEEAQIALQDARRALGEGRYGRAEEAVVEARKALGKRQAVRDRLARAIQDTKRKVELLRAAGSDAANDVEEMVLRAEREFENGDLVNSSEDLRIATLLMGKTRPAERPATPK
ncbi:MAG: hypothetical protein A3K65_09510 [Euryarchaeota archaeon RBG_16_68_12]|nr:MAG: hypothetical protein A3K65_09510 [Euryarchaeota archaeon RBG_16_68_12]